jgi:hypothetical protein
LPNRAAIVAGMPWLDVQEVPIPPNQNRFTGLRIEQQFGRLPAVKSAGAARDRKQLD